MLIACDTSSALCSVAVVDQGEVLFKNDVQGEQIHIKKLSPFLKDALSFCKAMETSPAALGIAIGPGSFNGLRIGLATMKALALTLDLPLIPIPTTDALAYGARNSISGLCRAVIFSHRDFVHTADYVLETEGSISTPVFRYNSWDDLFQEEIDHYFGAADRGFATWLAMETGSSVQDKFYRVAADAAQVALLAELRPENMVSDLDGLEPFYNAEYKAKKWVPPSF
ncbi:tRNA (adenosine(37)-N6)-threonylcarbamoyltransferase complex dimerization subunit type 1 TsaB [bacterium]|nr:tRNA (adenosine(37)-N6)-threonylcarbamoyltransferase complex dimerization subunit type 1 TsaB [bacterium]